jgi:hypothetical protein
VVLMPYDWKKSEDFPKESKLSIALDIVDTPLFKRCLYGVSALTFLVWLFRDTIGGQ